MKTTMFRAFVVFLAVGWVCSAHAGPEPEQQCRSALYKAAGLYGACEQHSQARLELTPSYDSRGFVFQTTVSKCRVTYTSKWTKLQASYPATPCAIARFVDNGETVTDNLTGLMWEKKQNLDGTANVADPHDADNLYTWSVTGAPGDGSVFTDFLPALNGGGCFAGECDWRLPTRDELQTILSEPEPCAASPCIDPLFGPTAPSFYWSSTSDAMCPTDAWSVDFHDGMVYGPDKSTSYSARAVRGGL
jgi:uncharacterized protein DUF1566